MPTAKAKGIPHRGVWIYVLNHKRELLLLQRSNKAVTCPDTWMPLGEHCQPSEPYVHSVFRGLHEEIALLPRDIALIQPLITSPMLLHIIYNTRKRDIQWTMPFLVQLHDNVTIQFNEDEASSMLWMPLSSITHWLSECPDQKCRSCQTVSFALSNSKKADIAQAPSTFLKLVQQNIESILEIQTQFRF